MSSSQYTVSRGQFVLWTKVIKLLHTLGEVREGRHAHVQAWLLSASGPLVRQCHKLYFPQPYTRILHNCIHVHQYVTIHGKTNDKAGKKSFELRSDWESTVCDAPT